MPWCPNCKTEYREGITHCADCKVELVAEYKDVVLKNATAITASDTRNTKAVIIFFFTKNLLSAARAQIFILFYHILFNLSRAK